MHVKKCVTVTFTSSSSSGFLPPGISKCPTTPLFSMLCFFLEFPVSVFHHPVHEFLSRSSSFHIPLHSSLHYLSLQRVTSQNVSYPVLLSYSDYILQQSFFFLTFT